MSSSRVFVKNLPPSLTEQDFKGHFSKRFDVTDIKLIPSRRIGYVGFTSQENASLAVKYFNKSFIRMSRLSVELADDSLQKLLANATSGPKRARSDRGDSKYRNESNANKKAKFGLNKDPDHQGLESGQNGPHPFKNGIPDNKDHKEDTDGSSNEHSRGEDKQPTTDEHTDANWMRSRTSRLLGLLDDEEKHGNEPSHETNGSKEAVKRKTITQESTSSPDAADEGRDGDTDGRSNAEDANQTIETLKRSKRLFVRNIPYQTTEDQLADLFQVYGVLQEAHIPLKSKTGEPKGFAFVQFLESSAAIAAFQNLDGQVFQGRILHILPAAVKETGLNEFELSKLPLKKQRQIQKKAEASSSTFNWNSMFMSADAVISSISDRLGVSKSDLLDPSSSDAAVKQAQAETHIIRETKSYFENNGVNLDAFGRRDRDDSTILVKNFPYGTDMNELRSLFVQFGDIARMLMPPSGTIAIIQFTQLPQARAAFSALAYRKFKDSVLFLEKAPRDLFVEVQDLNTKTTTITSVSNNSAPELVEEEDERQDSTSTLFVRNLNFTTTNEKFRETFQPLDGFISARVKTKPDPKHPGQYLSMGFGFLEFRSAAQARTARAAMDGHNLEGHSLLIRPSHKTLDAAEERRKADDAQKRKNKKSKIVIKNLPFEASKKDVRNLFKSYGQLRAVRVPKKFDNSRKGFAFAEFTTPKEAESAIFALRDTHLLGRRLVLDFAAGETEDPEQEIWRMQRKVGRQTENVQLQELAKGSERRKFDSSINTTGDEDL